MATLLRSAFKATGLATLALASLGQSSPTALASSPEPSQVFARQPTVRFATASQLADESAGSVSVEVRVDVGWPRKIKVPYELLGTAVEGVDYLVDLPSPLVFEPKQKSVVLHVTLLEEHEREGLEQILIRLKKPKEAALGKPKQHVIYVADDDAITGDDFNRCEGLGSLWSTLDPSGDATFGVAGVGTPDAWATVAVPGGSSHAPDGTYLPARIAQVVVDLDVDLALRIDSELAGEGQLQGWTFEQSNDDWLSAELYRLGPDVRLAVRSTSAGVTTLVHDEPIAAAAPYFLGVERAGDQWTFSWSDDGASWNELPAFARPLVMLQVGLFAGNAGGASAPAHQAAFDWFDYRDASQADEDGSIPGSGPFTLTTLVTGQGGVQREPDQAEYTCSDVVTVTALADAGWVFDHWEGDLGGTTNPETVAMTGDRTVTAVFAFVDQPPVISNVVATPTEDGAWITWDTDEPATSLVEYGPDATYGSQVSDGTLVTAHALLVSGLPGGTTQHFRVCSTDAGANTSCSGDGTFQTILPSGLVSDDFNHCEGLVAPWTFVDPIGDASYRVTGVGTADAWLRLAVPAGSDHVADGGALAARVVQPVNDTDFAFELVPAANPALDGQELGTTVEESAGEWIAFGVHRSGGVLFARVASTVAGTTTTMADLAIAPAGAARLRVTRALDDWTFEWSEDGLAWSAVAAFARVLAPVQVGVYAANSGGATAPAHEGAFDWFEDPSSPLASEDGSIPGSGPFTLTTLATGQGGVGREPDQAEYTCSDVVTVTAVADAGWVFDHWEGDLGGTTNPETVAMTGDRAVTAVFAFVDQPPVISNVVATPTEDGAWISWDTDEPATSLVEYGPDATYGSQVSDGTLVTSHALLVSGLPGGTTQHFRVCSTDAGANTSCSGDGTFQTLSASGLVSDDFNHCEGLVAPWTFVDPIGDASYRVTGVGSDDAWLELAVPAGSTHVPFNGVLPARVVQPVADADFQYEVRFDSDLLLVTQLQGTTIEQDGANWLRFDLFRSSTGTRAFIGSTTDNVTATVANVSAPVGAPMYLRVTRAVDTFTFEWSDDPTANGWSVAATLNRVLVPTQVSLYAGNATGASAPAHVARVDWFQDTAQPLVVEDGDVPGSGPFTLTVDATGSGSVQRSPDQPTYSCSDVVTLTAVADPGWSFDHWEGDLGGSQNPETIAMGGDHLVTAAFVQDATPPTISNVVVTPTGDGAWITWDTDEPATSRVDYGPDATYGMFLEDPTLVLAHALQITGVPPDTLQHFMLTSVDGGGLSDTTPDATFTTLSAWTAVSDDFNQCALQSWWTYEDPQGDAPAPFLQGQGTSDAQVVLSVPGGAPHEAYAGVIGAPNLMQSVNDVDFGLEVKYDSDLVAAYQIQGVLVKQDAQRWLRFDLYRGTSSTRLYAASNTGSTTTTIGDFDLGQLAAPMWLGVERVGDQWWVRWSANGTSWTTVVSGVTQALVVSEAGPYVGNASGASSPAHTALVDYFFDVAEPIANEDGNFTGGGPFTLSTFVDPPGVGSILVDPDQPEYDCSDVVTLTAVPTPGWAFTSWSGDLAGSSNPETLAMSADRVVTAHFSQDQDPPLLSGIAAQATSTEATITWTTDEPADSQVDYGLTSSYTDQVYDPGLVTQHTVLLTGLTPGTTYHYLVTSADVSGNAAQSGDLVFTTAPDSALASDDFNHPNLDLSVWEWIDPLAGDGLLLDQHAQLRLTGSGTSDAHLEIEVPADVLYLPWIQNGAARVRQAAADTDFEVELKIESNLTASGQTVGFYAEEDASRWLRFDLYHSGSALTIVRASFQNGVSSNFKQTTIQSGPWNGAPIWMRVARVGNQWTQRYSLDGANFVSNGAPFSFAAAIGGLGLMAGNDSPNPAGFTAAIDTFTNLADPLQQEDVGTPVDATSPYLYASDGRAASDSTIRVVWGTDEPTTSTLVWGFTQGVYDQGSHNGDPGVTYDETLVGGLLADTTYHFQVRSSDLAGNPVTFGPDFSVTTGPEGSSGAPTIAVWYGQPNGQGETVLRFGNLGMGQTWANVLGNVQDDIGEVVSLSYTLNGGAPSALSMGQGGFTPPYRLVSEGDFNAEIDASLLLDDSVGMNEVWITAVDDDGLVASRRVWIDYDADSTWPEDVTIDWSEVSDLQDAVQIVDGEWEIDPDSGFGGTPALRNSRNGVAVHGYDRLFLLGDDTWDDYEFTVTVTVHELNPLGYYPVSNSHAIGLIFRWPGHMRGSQQPREGFFPFGGLFAYRWFNPGVNERWNAYGTDYDPNILFPNMFMQVVPGISYVFKGRCESQPNGETIYRVKAWEVGAPETPDWLEMTTPAGSFPSGSLLFLAHEVDASFGNITVTPLN